MFVFFHEGRHPAEMAGREINVFPTHPAVTEEVGGVWLMAGLVYGGSLRLMECLRFRAQDVGS